MNIVRGVLLAFAAFICTAVDAGAQDLAGSPFRGRLRYAGSISRLIANHDSVRAGERKLIAKLDKPFRVTAESKTSGVVTAVFDRLWIPRPKAFFDDGYSLTPDPTRPIHLRGRIRQRGQGQRVTTPVAATVFDGSRGYKRIEISFLRNRRIVGTGTSAFRSFTFKLPLEAGSLSDSLSVSTVPGYAVAGKSCGSSDSISSSAAGAGTAAASANGPSTKALRVIELATEADYQWFAGLSGTSFSGFGSESNSRIRSIINSAETIYEDQLGLTFSLGTQVVVTSSSGRYTSSTSSTLLGQFQNYTNSRGHLGDADLYHLFTGKNLESTVIGIAYLDVVCNSPSNSYGLTQHFATSLDHITTAHEIGHNFGAEHVDGAGTIMSTTLDASSPPTQFAASSKSAIAAHVDDFGSCLSVGEGDGDDDGGSGGGGTTPVEPVPDPELSLSLSMSRSGDFAALISLETVTEGCELELRAAQTRGGAASGGTLASVGGGFASTLYQFSLHKKSQRKNRNGRDAKVFVAAVRTCPGQDVEVSNVTAIRPYTIQAARPISINRWLTELRSAIRSTSPQQQ